MMRMKIRKEKKKTKEKRNKLKLIGEIILPSTQMKKINKKIILQ